MKRWLPSLAVVVFVSCVPLTPREVREPRGSHTPPSLEIEGELRRGDDVCEFLCDKHRFTWDADTVVTVQYFTEDHGRRSFASLREASGTEGARFLPDITISGEKVDVRAGVAYEMQVAATDRHYQDTYKLTLVPPPATSQLAEERPVPPPPTPEEDEPDATMAARIAELTAGWSAVGKSKRVDLTSKKRKPLTWKAKAGGCYSAYLVLEAGSRLENKSDLDLHLSVKDKYASHGTSGFFHTDSRRILNVGGDDGLCAETSGSVELRFGEPGTGELNVTLYERRTDAAALKEQALEDDRGFCTACMEQRLACQGTGHTGPFSTCKAQFRDCIQGLRVQCKP